MPADAEDLELIARANRGDASALDELYRRHSEWVRRLARRRLGDDEEALDVMQETFLVFFARFPGFELTAAMTTFLHPIVDNFCRRRRMRQRRTVDFDENIPPPSALREDSQDISDSASLLGRVSAEQRELLRCYFLEDESFAQLAERFDAPVGTIKSRLHYATMALRQKAATPLRRRGAL
jgi:RNA polymerase sigma-70 factor, ECF subfamily